MSNTRSVHGWLIVIWLIVSAGFTLLQLANPAYLVGDLLYLAVAVSASVVAWFGALRLHGSDRLVGMLFAAGVILTSVGDLLSRLVSWRAGVEPDASVADLPWLLTYGCIGAGLVLLLRQGTRGPRADIDGLIDVGVVFVAGMLVIWEPAITAVLSDASLPWGIRVLWGAYPVLDLVLLALAVRLIMRDRTTSALLIAAGVALWLTSDFAYLAIAEPDSYSVLLDVGWLWGAILILLAVLRGPSARSRLLPPPRQSIDEVGLGRILLALLPLLVPGLVELYGYLRGEDVNPLLTIVGTMVLVLLAFLRMARLAWAARAARAALASQERYASALAANSSDAVVVVDAGLRMMADFPRLAELVGYPGQGVGGARLLTLVVPADLPVAQATARRSIASPGRMFEVEVRIRHGSGRQRWLDARVVNLLADPDVQGLVVNLHDITARKQAEEELGHQAFHDALTGLANRALFRDRLDHALDREARTGADPAVIFLDLDGFKTVNDSLGHDLGDQLLREVGDRLADAAPRGDTVGRLGGDEFAILIEQSHRPLADASEVAERVLQALRDPVPLGDQSITISASLGIAVGDPGSDSAGLLRDADVAMYRAKAAGRGKWTVYDPDMRSAALARMELEAGLHAALRDGDFRLHYQPVVELESERLVGFEALLRWQHPHRGLLAPDDFIPVAEETGLIVAIGRWVLREATSTAARWQRRCPSGHRLMMAVNLSASQLADPDLVADVRAVLARTGLKPASLVLEMTESVLVQDPPAVAGRLRELSRLGVRLAIDDFGTGYSSLSYLRQFPVDILKIDRSFVETIPERGEIPAIVRGLLDLGRTLQLETVAEGVEWDFQRTRLREERCNLAQGFLIARPMPPADAERLLDQLPRPVPGEVDPAT